MNVYLGGTIQGLEAIRPELADRNPECQLTTTSTLEPNWRADAAAARRWMVALEIDVDLNVCRIAPHVSSLVGRPAVNDRATCRSPLKGAGGSTTAHRLVTPGRKRPGGCAAVSMKAPADSSAWRSKLRIGFVNSASCSTPACFCKLTSCTPGNRASGTKHLSGMDRP